MSLRIAVLDDYAGVARAWADWPAEDRIDVFSDTITDRGALAERLRPHDVLCVMRERTPLPGPLLEALPNLKLIVTSGARNLSIDTATAARLGITVCGTESRGSVTAELVMALMLALSRRIVPEANSVAAGGWQTGIGRDLSGLTLGIVGYGRIGTKVAELARPFGMKILAWSRSLTAQKAAALGVDHAASLGEVMARADVASVHLVLAEATRGLIGAEEFAVMRPGALFLNTSRGPIVDTRALMAGLRAGRPAGAAIDVFDTEPLPAGAAVIDRELIAAGRLLLSPHLGYVSEQTFRLFYTQMVEAIAAWKAGAPIRVIGTGAQATPKA